MKTGDHITLTEKNSPTPRIVEGHIEQVREDDWSKYIRIHQTWYVVSGDGAGVLEIRANAENREYTLTLTGGTEMRDRYKVAITTQIRNHTYITEADCDVHALRSALDLHTTHTKDLSPIEVMKVWRMEPISRHTGRRVAHQYDDGSRCSACGCPLGYSADAGAMCNNCEERA